MNTVAFGVFMVLVLSASLFIVTCFVFAAIFILAQFFGNRKQRNGYS